MHGPRVMADDLVEVHGRCGKRFAALVAEVGPGQWHDGTPCSEWAVRTLVHHLLYEQRWVPLLFEGLTIGQIGDRFEGDLMGGDAAMWPGLLASSIEQAHAAVAQPEALDRDVHLSFGDASGREYVTQLTADLAIHGWDLARATGQDDTLDPGAVALLLPWAEANADLLAGSGMFGSRIEAGPGTPDDVRLLGLLGRCALALATSGPAYGAADQSMSRMSSTQRSLRRPLSSAEAGDSTAAGPCAGRGADRAVWRSVSQPPWRSGYRQARRISREGPSAVRHCR